MSFVRGITCLQASQTCCDSNWSCFTCGRHFPFLPRFPAELVRFELSSVFYAQLFVKRSMRQWCNMYYWQMWNSNDRKNNRFFYFCLYILENLNILSLQQWKLLKYMYAKCLTFPCFINHLLAHISTSYKNLMQPSRVNLIIKLWSIQISWIVDEFFWIKIDTKRRWFLVGAVLVFVKSPI